MEKFEKMETTEQVDYLLDYCKNCLEPEEEIKATGFKTEDDLKGYWEEVTMCIVAENQKEINNLYGAMICSEYKDIEPCSKILDLYRKSIVEITVFFWIVKTGTDLEIPESIDQKSKDIINSLHEGYHKARKLWINCYEKYNK